MDPILEFQNIIISLNLRGVDKIIELIIFFIILIIYIEYTTICTSN